MHKIRQILFAILILALTFANPVPNAVASALCTAGSCLYLPVVRGAGSVDQAVNFTVVEKGYDAIRGIFGNIWGELTASRPAINVVVEARVYDKDTNELAGVAAASPILTATLPGQLNPFYLWTSIDSIDHPDTYDVLTVISWQPMSGAEFMPVTVVYSQTNIYGLVTAGLLNDTGKTLSNVRGMAWYHSHFSYLPPDGPTMAPGETITMTFKVPDIGPVYDVRIIKIAVQGIAEEPAPAASPVLPSFSLFPDGALGEFR